MSRIGFYAPLKAPDHPVPSGDRQMARLLMAALEQAGHAVTVYSRLRTWSASPEAPLLEAHRERAMAEQERLATAWAEPARRPDLLFTYHPYYKAPDLLGPALASRFGLPYVTAEASLSARRWHDEWAQRQALVAEAVRGASLNLCLTARDRAGLAAEAPGARLADLPPFFDPAMFRMPGPARDAAGGPPRLVTIAMMRHGDKLASYRFLAAALATLSSRGWQLTVVGDGPARADVQEAFESLGENRVRWVGAVASDEVPGHLRQAEILAWPGFNEAFGLCYLEAQACGVPVVAVRSGGTPEVIQDGVTGLLTAADPAAYAAALDTLIGDEPMRRSLGAAGMAFVHGERGLPAAARRLDALLGQVRSGSRA